MSKERIYHKEPDYLRKIHLIRIFRPVNLVAARTAEGAAGSLRSHQKRKK